MEAAAGFHACAIVIVAARAQRAASDPIASLRAFSLNPSAYFLVLATVRRPFGKTPAIWRVFS